MKVTKTIVVLYYYLGLGLLLCVSLTSGMSVNNSMKGIIIENELNIKDWGPCNLNNVVGTCMDYHDCKGQASPLNLCPGPDAIQCCFSGRAPGLVNVPLVSQLPQLKNGCEVTSLTMLLNWVGINADKMTLASQIAKDPTPYNIIGGVIHWGNPNVGFVGDITGARLGYAVYHGPILNLANRYHGGIDLTGLTFDQVLNYVATGRPVWVITSFTFTPITDWHTVISPEGSYQMSFNEHSVVVTGFNSEYVWVNDPWHNIKNSQLQRSGFQTAWEQFGHQAIVLK